MNLLLVKACFFVGGLFFGGLVVFGVVELVENSSSSSSASSSSGNGTRNSDSLQLVVVVSRHGNKVVSYNYPNDPYPGNDSSYWHYEKGALTQQGRLQEYNLGAKLRSLYNGFLNTTFYTGDIFATTDLYERTMMSGELVLAGLYPPVGWQVWNKDVNWQPVPLYTNSTDHTKDIHSCARAAAERAKTYKVFLETETDNITQLINQTYNSTGEEFTINGLINMYEKLLSEETEGFSLPQWTSSLYPGPLSDLYGKRILAYDAGNDEITRLWIGDLLDDIIATLENKSKGNLGNLKMAYYSGHDDTVLNLQIGLGAPRYSVVKIVKTGSALVIELHKSPSSSNLWLEVLYIDGSSLDSDPSTLSLPDCGDPCYLESFINSTKRFTNVSYEEECQSTSFDWVNL